MLLESNIIVLLAISTIGRFLLGLFVGFKAWQKERRGRIWAENQYVKAHEKILELEASKNNKLY